MRHKTSAAAAAYYPLKQDSSAEDILEDNIPHSKNSRHRLSIFALFLFLTLIFVAAGVYVGLGIGRVAVRQGAELSVSLESPAPHG